MKMAALFGHGNPLSSRVGQLIGIRLFVKLEILHGGGSLTIHNHEIFSRVTLILSGCWLLFIPFFLLFFLVLFTNCNAFIIMSCVQSLTLDLCSLSLFLDSCQTSYCMLHNFGGLKLLEAPIMTKSSTMLFSLLRLFIYLLFL